MVNTREKGRRNERKCIEVLEARGYDVCRAHMTRYGRNDFFNLFDIVAVKPDAKPLFIQVKSNNFSGKSEYESKSLALMNLEHARVEAWIWHDYQGWRIFELEEDGWKKKKDER